MRRTTFPNARLSEFLPNFEWYQMDTDSADAAPFVGRYGVRTSPTFIVVDQAGQELWRVSGHKQAGELASSLQNLLSGMSRVAQRHERMISQLTERLAAAHTALQAGDFKQSLRALQWIERAARGSGYAQWLDESERGLAFLRGRLERVLADLERRAGTDSEGVAAAAREFRKNYGLAFPDLGRRADALVGR
ncbi:MAG: thioredoxin family protein [Planctomycetes bacterium]|nr:thioredoxin family protein [Planctomycetota bacterium]